MKNTIKEITKAFSEVIEKYDNNIISNYDINEGFDERLKEELKSQMKSELEEVVKRFSGDPDDFTTAFAELITCIIKFDLAKGSAEELSEEEDTDGRLYIKSIRESIENVIDDKQPDAEKLRVFLQKFSKAVCENDYLNAIAELYSEYGSDYSIVKLYSFCYIMYRYCSAEETDEEVFWHNSYLTKIFASMNSDFQDYAFLVKDYEPEDVYDTDWDINLLPFCLDETRAMVVARSISCEYEELCETLGVPNSEIMDLNSFLDHLNNLNSASDQCDAWNLTNDILSGIHTLSLLVNDEHEDIYSHAINRRNASERRALLIHIPTCVSVKKISYKQLFHNELELEKANNDKDMLISSFCHRYKNMRANSLYRISHALLKMDDANLKMYGRLALLEYGIKEELVKEVEMLRLKFHNTRESRGELVTKVSKSIDYAEDDAVSILDILRKAITRSVITVVHDVDSEAKMIRRFCFSDCDLISLRNSFESKLLFHENGDAVSWLDKNIIKLSVTLSDEWKKIRFKSGQYMDIVLSDLISEMIMNAFKYADKSQPMTIKFSEKQDALIVKSSNMTVSSKKGIPSSKQGIKSNKSILDILNEACGLNEESIETEESADGVFSVTAVIGKALLPKEV